MKKAATIAAFIAIGFVCAVPGTSQDKAGLAKKQNSMNSEYSLAKESNFYFVLDVLGRKLELRVRGMVLRSWPLKSMKFWGRPGFSGNVELVHKSTLNAPERIIIKPGDAAKTEPAPAAKPLPSGTTPANPAEFELEALELKDMPKRFRLDFDNGLHVAIKSNNAGPAGFLGALGEAWRWYVDLPLRNLFSRKDGKGLAELQLTFESDKDAQAIYWHFFEGIKGIIL